MKTTLLFFATIITSLSYSQCTDLFISEYVEGRFNNKALEIYNPTANTIDLSEYMIVRYSNGATTATSEYAVQLTGMIAPNDVHVGVVEKLDTNGTGNEEPIWDSLWVRADAFYSPVYATNKTFYWNGNDCVALMKGSVASIGSAELVDFFGKLGEDPGIAWTTIFPFTSAGVEVTKDHSLIRKSTVTSGNLDPLPAFFEALVEYDSIPAEIDIAGTIYGNWSTLGSHTCDCIVGTDEVEAAPKVSIYPNPSTGKFTVNGAENYSQISVMNALGQKVTSISDNSEAVVSFDLKAKRGVYFVKLKDDRGNVITKRVIVK
jgi:hypothetical protein